MSEDINSRLENFDAMLDGMRQIGEMLTGSARALMADGWTEQQARDIVVAAFVSSARQARK